MNGLKVALKVESLKFRLSPVVWITTLVLLVLVPLVAVGGYELAHGSAVNPSALKARAMMQGEGWAGLFGLAAQVAGVAVFGGVGIVISWCLGREFAEQTVVGLFAQPVPRARIALAKTLVTLLWAAALSLLTGLLVYLGGIWLGLNATEGVNGTLKLVGLGLLMSVSSLPAAWVASAARGYLPGIGAVIGLVVFTQLAMAVGAGAWLPWAAPVLWSGAAGAQAAAQVTSLQLLLPALVGLGATLALCWWWQHAELGHARG